ncbi:MAG: pyridoxamine 5'-phosphate oxidase family protein [Desulfofustis sp.]|nr:pyridoxamine 5'-phosphate oxidase family protein [Desulfofustis sp.]
MTDTEQEVRDQIRSLLDSQRLAVLATQCAGQPYTSLMAFAYTDDLRRIVVATGQATRKRGNMEQDPRVCLLIDNRANSADDFHQASALTAVGRARQVDGDDAASELRRCYLQRHPTLQQFVCSPTTVLLAIEVSHYLLVNRFQHVFELRLVDERESFPPVAS